MSTLPVPRIDLSTATDPASSCARLEWSIKGSLGLLTGTLLETLPGSARHLLTIAQGNTDRLLRLIDDILDIDKLSAGRLEFSRRRCSVADTGPFAQAL